MTAGMAGDTKFYIWLRVQTLHHKAHIGACFWKNKASATDILASTSSPEFSPPPLEHFKFPSRQMFILTLMTTAYLNKKMDREQLIKKI